MILLRLIIILLQHLHRHFALTPAIPRRSAAAALGALRGQSPTPAARGRPVTARCGDCKHPSPARARLG